MSEINFAQIKDEELYKELVNRKGEDTMSEGEILFHKDDWGELDRIDTEFQSAQSENDYDKFFEYGRSLNRDVHVRGLALMKFIHTVFKNAERFGGDPEDVLQIELGLKPDTTRKYYRVWDRIMENANIPLDVKERLLGLTTKSLLLLSATVAEYPDEIDWDEVLSTDEQGIRHIVKRIKGEATSSASSLYIYIDRKNTLYAKRGLEGKSYPIGFLMPEEGNDEGKEVRAAARHRIIERCAIYEQ